MIPLLNNYLATAAQDKLIKIWDVEQGKLKFTFTETSVINDIVELENGLIASATQSPQVN